jgi:hypothetical protein
MYGDQLRVAEYEPVMAGYSGGPSNRAVRRHARRHGQLTLGDQLAFWKAHWFGRQCSRGETSNGWPAHIRVTLVLLFLVAGLTVGVVFA